MDIQKSDREEKEQLAHEKDLSGKEALKKMKELAEKAKSCFFCSNIKTDVPLSVRPMSVLQIDDAGHFWFMSKDDSQKNQELKEDALVHLLFQGGTRSGFLNVYGISEVSKDKQKIAELWSAPLAIWFDGKDDPSISLIRVEPLEVHYWDNEHGDLIALVKMAAGVVTGKKIHDGVHGDLEV
ncbi:General stress protein 26 [bacterium A37T11]|nr:General stress protein 26 [bacterium A37T11]